MGDRVILHSDINCCYASIEHLHHPELAGKPLAVGGDPEARHGIVLTADYIAKKYGVKTGMALWQAKEVCPDITFVSPRMDLYLRFSRMAHEIYAEYTDRQEPYGIDECWLDVTGSSSLKGDGLLIAQEISRRMKSELGITVSVGVSFNKIFAKLGSDYKKPDAITTMYKSEFKQKAWSLPVADLLYVGKSTNRKLALFGIKTIGDLARTDEEVINSHLGKMGSILYVDVLAEFSKDGLLIPKEITWEDGRKYEITRVKDKRRAASTRAGGVGERYTCVVDGKEIFLFYEDNNMWFMERAGA